MSNYTKSINYYYNNRNLIPIITIITITITITIRIASTLRPIIINHHHPLLHNITYHNYS